MVSRSEEYLIDRTVYRGFLSPVVGTDKAESPDGWHHVTVTTQMSGYTVSMRLTCEPGRYNYTCEKVCFNNNTARYKCDDNGDKVCEPGWSGLECDQGG